MLSVVKKGLACLFFIVLIGGGVARAEDYPADKLVSEVTPAEFCTKGSSLIEKESTKRALCKIFGVVFGKLGSDCSEINSQCLKNYDKSETECSIKDTSEILRNCSAPAILIDQCFEDYDRIFNVINKTVSCALISSKAKSKRAKRKINNLNTSMSSCELLNSLCPAFKIIDN
jgi:hypothetical protein